MSLREVWWSSRWPLSLMRARIHEHEAPKQQQQQLPTAYNGNCSGDGEDDDFGSTATERCVPPSV